MIRKKYGHFSLKLALFFLCAAFLWPKSAYAYLDPGSGYLIMQIIIAALAAIPLAFKKFRRLVISLFKKMKPPSGD